MSSERNRYNPGLDGLRAFAVAMVIVYHSTVSWGRGGYLGVDVFYVLSGYLISRSLVDEWKRYGRVSFINFYARRALRLLPALILLLAAYLCLAEFFFGRSGSDSLSDASLAMLYVTDYTMAFEQTPQLLAHTWSLGVEEKFYIIAPLALVWWLRRSRYAHLAWYALGLAVILTLWRQLNILIGVEWHQVYYRFDTRASGLAMGCALGLSDRFTSPTRMRQPVVMGLGIIILSAALFPTDTQRSLLVGTTLVELASCMMIIGLEHHRATVPSRLFSVSVMAYLGRISYGIYLWNYPICRWLREFAGPWVALIVGGALSIIVAAISYHTVEKLGRMGMKRLRTHRAQDQHQGGVYASTKASDLTASK